MSPAETPNPHPRPPGGFTLIELLAVIAIVLVLTLLLAPAFTSLKSAGDVTNAAYTIKGVLEQARTYAMANNTYTWVGFYEEDASQPPTTPATSGNGRIVLSIAASKDGTTVYNRNSNTDPDPIDPTRLTQVGKLIRIENVHLPIFADGSGTGATFDARPPADASFDNACSCYDTRNSRFGDLNAVPPNSAPSADSQFPFQYPVGNPTPTAQYLFRKILQFNPRGESSFTVKYTGPPSYKTYNTLRVVEIGLLSTHGITVPTPTPSAGQYVGNVAAIQITGLGGNIKVYRR